MGPTVVQRGTHSVTLFIERVISMTIVRALAQNKGVYHTFECSGGEL